MLAALPSAIQAVSAGLSTRSSKLPSHGFSSRMCRKAPCWRYAPPVPRGVVAAEGQAAGSLAVGSPAKFLCQQSRARGQYRAQQQRLGGQCRDRHARSGREAVIFGDQHPQRIQAHQLRGDLRWRQGGASELRLASRCSAGQTHAGAVRADARCSTPFPARWAGARNSRSRRRAVSHVVVPGTRCRPPGHWATHRRRGRQCSGAGSPASLGGPWRGATRRPAD
jgi:hypothetical protein